MFVRKKKNQLSRTRVDFYAQYFYFFRSLYNLFSKMSSLFDAGKVQNNCLQDKVVKEELKES